MNQNIFSSTLAIATTALTLTACQTPKGGTEKQWGKAEMNSKASVEKSTTKEVANAQDWPSPKSLIKVTPKNMQPDIIKTSTMKVSESKALTDSESGNYILNVGSFSDPSNANKLYEMLSKGGLDSHLNTYQHTKYGSMTAVQVRNLKSIEQAESAATKSLEILKGHVNKVYLSKNKKLVRWVNSNEPLSQPEPKVNAGKEKAEPKVNSTPPAKAAETDKKEVPKPAAKVEKKKEAEPTRETASMEKKAEPTPKKTETNATKGWNF